MDEHQDGHKPADLEPGPGLGWELSDETKKALKEIENNIRSATLAASTTYFD